MSDLKSILSQLGVETSDDHHHSRSGWLQLKNCPYCHSQNYHLGIKISFMHANCYRCGRHNLVEALSMLSNQPAKRIADLLKEFSPKHHREEKPADFKSPAILELPEGITKMGPAHLRYLAERGFSPNKLKRLWGLKGLGLDAGRFAWRIFIPIEVGGRMVSWTTRSIKPDAKLRYMTCRSEACLMPRNQILYGIDYVRHCVILTEGPADVWSIGPSAVCSLGTSISSNQLLQISKFPIRVICLDSQEAAQKTARGLVKQLEVFDGETYNVGLDAKDPGAATRKEIKHMRSFFRI